MPDSRIAAGRHTGIDEHDDLCLAAVVIARNRRRRGNLAGLPAFQGFADDFSSFNRLHGQTWIGVGGGQVVFGFNGLRVGSYLDRDSTG